eukprot:s2235_g13.t1
MVSIVDSEAQFDQRLNQVKVPALLQRALKAAGVNTIPSLAYAFGQPGQPIPSDEFATWVRSLEPTATVGGVASLKRLLFESQTQLLADLKEKILNPEPTVARKVPAAERDARLVNLKMRLTGVVIEGHSEPSHSLLDLATQLYDQNVLRWIPLEKCYSRLTELSFNNKPQSKLLEVESSKIVVRDKESEHEAQVESSYQVLEALKRRGLALDFAGVMSFVHHEKYVQVLFAHLNRDPPPGYNRCSVSQLIAADRAAWCHLIEKNVKPRPDAAGVLELNTKLEEALKTYEVSFTLLPLAAKQVPKPAAPSAPSVRPPQNNPTKGNGKRNNNRFSPYNSKGKGKGKRNDQRVPKEIRDAGGLCLRLFQTQVDSRAFSTAEETAYPLALAYHIAFFMAQELHETLAHWLERGKVLVQQEAELHKSLHGDLRAILAPKRLLLWKEMMTHYGYPDVEVFDEVVSGIELFGTAPFVPSFDPSFKPAQITASELEKNAPASRAALFASIRSTGDAQLDEEVFSKTLAELECGWLEGPLDPSELPDNAVVSRRFGIKQTSGDVVKVRLIDDFSASGVNSTVQVESACKLHTLDVAAAMCFELLQLSGKHPWVGKTLDLSAAYRQLGVSPGSRWVSYIAVFDPATRKPKVFAMKALPFGASRSVYGFLRVAHSLWWLGCVALKLVWSNFFDDFVTLARDLEATAVDIASSQFLKLLGWETASGEKNLPFSSKFKALGVEIDLSAWTSGKVFFSNTQKRADELIKTIDGILESKKLSLHGAQVLMPLVMIQRLRPMLQMSGPLLGILIFLSTAVSPLGLYLEWQFMMLCFPGIFFRTAKLQLRVLNFLGRLKFYRELFNDEPPQPVPRMPISDACDFHVDVEPQAVASAIAEVAKFSDSNPVHSLCVGSADDVQFHVKRQQLRDAAIGKLLIILRHCLLASATGRHIINLGNAEQQDAGAFEIVDAVVGIRSSATLVKRANSLLSYLRWYAKAGHVDVNPFEEKFIWDYFLHLKESGAPETRADSALSAFRFAFYILGFECLEAALKSRRLVGVCEIMLAGKRLLRQALPLTVVQINRLHRLLVDVNVHLVDRAVIAYILFALYGRCRNSDLQMIHALRRDFDAAGGFVVIETCNHKSGRKAALKTRLMPIVVPARGVDGKVWTDVALKVFEDVGVDLDNPIDGPLMRAPADGEGAFMLRGFKSSEVSAMLRRFLELDDPTPGSEVEIVSSHSLKSTLLAWCARYGLAPSTRSMLGRHISALNETFAIYSRDLVCAPVAELQTVIDAVHAGSFQPDSQRSEFFKSTGLGVDAAQGHADFEGPCDGVYTPAASHSYEPSLAGSWELTGSALKAHEAEVHSPGPSNAAGLGGDDASHAAHDSGSSDSSSSDGDGFSSDGSDLVEPPARVKRFRAKIPAEEKWYVHSRSHLVHRYDGNSHQQHEVSCLWKGAHRFICVVHRSHRVECFVQVMQQALICQSFGWPEPHGCAM